MREKRALVRHAVWIVPALLLVGCGGGGDGKAEGTSTKAAESSAPPASSPAASPTPTRPGKAGESGLAACADARCETEVKVGDVIRFNSRIRNKSGLTEMKVKSIGDMSINYDVADGGFGFGPPGSDDPANINGTFSHTLISTAGKTAVIRLGPTEPGAAELSIN